MATALFAALAAMIVLAPALAGFGRPRIYAMLGFTGIILGGAMLTLTPTPPGFDPNSESDRVGVSASAGQGVSAALLAAGAAGLLGAYAVQRKGPTYRDEHSPL